MGQRTFRILSRLRRPWAILPNVAQRTEDVIGWVDGVSRGRLQGWAFCRPYPLRRLTVDISTATGRRLVIVADRYRADLQRSGLGDGYYGFSVPLQRLCDSGRVRIATRAPYFELGIVNPWEGPPANARGGAIFRREWYSLQIDRPLGPAYVTGWAISCPSTNYRRVLRLRQGGKVLAQQRATLYRSELAVGDCDGYHGFALALPLGSRRSLAVEDADSGSLFALPS